MDIALAQFTSKTSSAGVVNVMLGFVPDLAIFVSGIDQTNPDVYIWANSVKLSQWGASRHLKITGSSGIITVVTTANQVLDNFEGGTEVSTAETTNTDPKHVNRAGTALATTPDGVAVSSTNVVVTRSGVRVPSQIQTASAINLLLALRGDV